MFDGGLGDGDGRLWHQAGRQLLVGIGKCLDIEFRGLDRLKGFNCEFRSHFNPPYNVF